MMFDLSSRMTLHGSLLLAAFAIAGSAALPTPAAAAKTSDVLAACKRTKGCGWSTWNDGTIVGCSPNACFKCSGGKCHQIDRTEPGGQKNVSAVGTAVGPASSASATKMSINGNVESVTRNKLPVNGPLINNGPPISNPGGMNGRMSGKH
jgi:hypothetical protein